MVVYVIFDSIPGPSDQMKGYPDKAVASVETFNGKITAYSSDIDTREGDWYPDRIVVIEFPDMARAQEWYESAEYQEILPIRLKVNRDKVVIVPGKE